MGKKSYAPIIAAAIVLSVLLFVPMIPYAYSGGQNISFNASVDSINLIVRSDATNVYVRYNSSSTAALIDIAWDYTIWHPIIASTSIAVNFENATAGSILSINFSSTIVGFRLAGVNFLATVITINPTLLTNLTIDVGSGNIAVDTANHQNKTVGNVALHTLSGNIAANFVNGTVIKNNLTSTTGSGNIDITLGSSCEVQGGMRTISSSGNNGIALGNGCILNNDFRIQTGSGNCYFTAINISLNGNDVLGRIITSSGNIAGGLTQRVTTNGNLTLDINTGSGNPSLNLEFAPTTIGSTIMAGTLSGNVYDTSLLLNGFVESPTGTYTNNVPNGNNINAIIASGSGNIYLLGGVIP